MCHHIDHRKTASHLVHEIEADTFAEESKMIREALIAELGKYLVGNLKLILETPIHRTWEDDSENCFSYSFDVNQQPFQQKQLIELHAYTYWGKLKITSFTWTQLRDIMQAPQHAPVNPTMWNEYDVLKYCCGVALLITGTPMISRVLKKNLCNISNATPFAESRFPGQFSTVTSSK